MKKEPSIRYNYPFANTAEESSVRVQSGFDIQAAIDKTKGTILEVGGPSIDGFYFLHGCSFPRRPIITNLSVRKPVKDKAFRQLYTPYIDGKLDIRKNPLHPQSVGICLAGSLPLHAKQPSPNNKKAWDQQWQALAEEDKQLRQDPKAMPKIGLRFILLKHALEFFEPGGLLIAESLREQEVKYALALGFSLRATTKPHKDDNQTLFRSIVLQR